MVEVREKNLHKSGPAIRGTALREGGRKKNRRNAQYKLAGKADTRAASQKRKVLEKSRSGREEESPAVTRLREHRTLVRKQPDRGTTGGGVTDGQGENLIRFQGKESGAPSAESQINGKRLWVTEGSEKSSRQNPKKGGDEGEE